MTTDQKQAIMVLMNLYNEEHIDEEQYFLLLDFIIDNKRHFHGLTEEQWEDYFKNRDITPPYYVHHLVEYAQIHSKIV